MPTRWWSALLLFALLLSSCAGKRTAQDRARQHEEDQQFVEQIFSSMDDNGDGKVTAEEMAKAADPEAGNAGEAFKLMDADGDGFATRAEVTAFAKKMGKNFADEL